MSNAKKTTRRSAPKTPVAQPTLHGLLIARSFSGTVVRCLLFVLLTFALVFVGVAAATDHTAGNAFWAWALIAGLYVLFDVLYVLMSQVRPLHPRLDRAILPGSLAFAIAGIYAPVLFVSSQAVNVVNVWVTTGVVLLCVLGVRLALLIDSSK